MSKWIWNAPVKYNIVNRITKSIGRYYIDTPNSKRPLLYRPNLLESLLYSRVYPILYS